MISQTAEYALRAMVWLAEYYKKPQTTDQIAHSLHLSPNTIGTHRERLKKKLRLKCSAELSHYATLWVAENG